MLTVKALLDELDLTLASGEKSASRPVRWVHISELEDPTPWLSGGEIVLTTGIQLSSAESQRRFVGLLAERELAALGLGTGFSHDKLPKALLAEARKHEFPVFEVPYEVPFIAITEAAAIRLVSEQFDALQRGSAINRRLERLVLEEQGLDAIVTAIATAISGAVCVLDANGRPMAQKHFRKTLPDEAMEAIGEQIAARGARGESSLFSPDHPKIGERALIYPIATRGSGMPQAWLLAVGDSASPGDFERLILQQAVTVVALELMRRRVARETERRLAGNVLSEALGGSLPAEELRGRLEPFGIGESAAVVAFSLDDPTAAEENLEQALRDTCRGSLVATHAAGEKRLLCAVVDSGDSDPIEIAAGARRALGAEHGPVRAAASRPAPVERLRRSFHEARCALEATAIDNGEAPEVASFRDLGAFTVLLSSQDDEALRLYCESVLAPIDDSEGDYGEELLRSLEAFIEHNGQWERAARSLYCHRHTLRYRIKRVEELTGRDLSRAHDRIEFWLALRGRELVA